jgi:hypothetical protein
MGNVIRLDGTPMSPEQPTPYQQIIDVLKSAGCDAFVIPVGALCGVCRGSDTERCFYPACPLYVGPTKAD